jgi:hypothetical protein
MRSGRPRFGIFLVVLLVNTSRLLSISAGYFSLRLQSLPAAASHPCVLETIVDLFKEKAAASRPRGPRSGIAPRGPQSGRTRHEVRSARTLLPARHPPEMHCGRIRWQEVGKSCPRSIRGDVVRTSLPCVQPQQTHAQVETEPYRVGRALVSPKTKRAMISTPMRDNAFTGKNPRLCVYSAAVGVFRCLDRRGRG